ncbi:transmembrane protein 242-like [Macrosteles quadrilineatus]|uniref:transmembrane protein 242-like n=1 Tax=Macrosteles quadrilineatus TaxID=74068 RepID=UPI0023E156FB|nr:transmembrane protein 242-like [Macrosteles quadrilineatus]XP_054263692.1 transmembrane protein 242-like [Macrosteles quadrilineatus]
MDENSDKPTASALKDKISYNMKAGLFLTSVAGAAGCAAFGATLMSARREDPSSFNKGMISTRELPESGVQLAARALKWGSVYAVCGVSATCAGIWLLSGAKNMAEFRDKMGSILPRIPKNNPPQSRTEFEGLTDLMNYIIHDYSGGKLPKNKDG